MSWANYFMSTIVEFEIDFLTIFFLLQRDTLQWLIWHQNNVLFVHVLVSFLEIVGTGLGVLVIVSIAVIVIVALATRRRASTRLMHPPFPEAGGIFNNYLPAMCPCWSLCLCILVVWLYNVSTDISMFNNCMSICPCFSVECLYMYQFHVSIFQLYVSMSMCLNCMHLCLCLSSLNCMSLCLLFACLYVY